MDYPKSVPNVGLVDGKFVDENPSTGQVGSLIPSTWGNSVTQELLSVITAAGLTPDENQVNQLLKAIQTFAAADMKKTVRVTTTGAVSLSGLQAIDGITLVSGDRVLVKNQANAAQNGIYSVAPGIWIRAQDADEDSEISPGMMVPVQAGDLNYGSIWQLSNVTPPSVGTTDLNFEQIVGNTGIAAGTYTSLTVDRLGRATAGTNPTTIAGYGITDGLIKGQHGLGGVVAPKVEIDVIGLPGGFYYYGDGYTSFENYVGLVNVPYGSSGHAGQLGFVQGASGETKVLVRAVDENGAWKSTRMLWHSGNLDPTALARKSTTLGGYGITDAYTQAQTNNLLAGKASLVSPVFTGAPTAPTAASGSNSLQLANTAFVQAAISALVSGAPGALDTLKELAEALGGDPNFATTVINALAGKAAKATTLEGYGITDGLKKGDYGLGGTTPSGLGIDFIGLPGGFYIKGEGETSFANYTSLINIPYGDGFAAQIGFGQSSDEPQIYVRGCKASNAWGKTRKLWHTGNLEAAQQADVDEGLNDEKFVTPKKIRSGFYFLPAANGVFALPSWLGGFILQWGKVTLTDGNSTVVNFPLAFPNAVLAHWSSINSNVASYIATCPTSGTSGATLSGMTVSYNDNTGLRDIPVGWFSIGR